MKLSLVVLSAGKAAGQTIPITLSQFTIGRDPQCNLRPASALISKRHCALLVKGGRVFVRDFDSTNGTFVNDKPIKGECELNHEDHLKLGPLAFRVVMEAGAPAVPVNKPTPVPDKAPAEQTDDESIAAMLLSLQEDGDSEVPGGSTVMDVAPTGAPKADETPADAGKPDAKKPEPKAQPMNTQSAAKAILDKYTRRQRG